MNRIGVKQERYKRMDDAANVRQICKWSLAPRKVGYATKWSRALPKPSFQGLAAAKSRIALPKSNGPRCCPINMYIYIYIYIRRTPCGSHGCRGPLQVQVSSIKCINTSIKYKYKYQVYKYRYQVISTSIKYQVSKVKYQVTSILYQE